MPAVQSWLADIRCVRCLACSQFKAKAVLTRPEGGQRSLLVPGKSQDRVQAQDCQGASLQRESPHCRGVGGVGQCSAVGDRCTRTHTHANAPQTMGSSIISNPVLLLVLCAATNPELDFAVSVFTSAEAARWGDSSKKQKNKEAPGADWSAAPACYYLPLNIKCTEQKTKQNNSVFLKVCPSENKLKQIY